MKTIKAYLILPKEKLLRLLRKNITDDNMNSKNKMEEKKLICVLCGHEWGVEDPFTNRCENENCSGLCTWGYQPNKPKSFFVDNNGKWHLKPPPPYKPQQ